MQKIKRLGLLALLVASLSACSTDTYVSQENVDKFTDPTVSKFYIQPCEVKKPEQIIAAVEHFAFDKAELSTRDYASLDDFITQIKDMQGRLIIMGHTDEQGSDQYNDKLALRRAQTVQSYLQTGLMRENYTWEVKSFGEHDPIFKEHTEQAFAQNRRVVVVFEQTRVESDKVACELEKNEG